MHIMDMNSGKQAFYVIVSRGEKTQGLVSQQRRRGCFPWRLFCLKLCGLYLWTGEGTGVG